MNIKQQQQIEKFLIEEFNIDKGKLLFEKQKEALNTLIENTKDKSKNQTKTLVQTILPRIALYKTLLANGFSKENAYLCIQKYMINKIGNSKNASMKKMESVPGFYSLYSNIFLKIMRKTDLQESTQNKGKNYFDVTISKCLWHTACVENDCAELCRLFCDVDNITYDGLKKMGFTRSKTLGYGNDCCDFHFFKK